MFNSYIVGLKPVGVDERLAVTSTPGPASAATINMAFATDFLCQNQGAVIYVTFDGSVPTGSNGFSYTDGEKFYLSRQELATASFYCATTSAVQIQPESR